MEKIVYCPGCYLIPAEHNTAIKKCDCGVRYVAPEWEHELPESGWKIAKDEHPNSMEPVVIDTLGSEPYRLGIYCSGEWSVVIPNLTGTEKKTVSVHRWCDLPQTKS